jgi:NCAIR mutase (PurE)-related protein
MVSNIDNGFSAGVAAARVVRAIRAASGPVEVSP